MKNQYKLAVIINFSTLFLALLSALPNPFPASPLLKRLLIVTSLIRYFSMDLSTGHFVALSQERLSDMIQILVIIATLDLGRYDMRMRMRRWMKGKWGDK